MTDPLSWRRYGHTWFAGPFTVSRMSNHLHRPWVLGRDGRALDGQYESAKLAMNRAEMLWVKERENATS